MSKKEVWLPDWIIEEELRREKDTEGQRPYLEVPNREPIPVEQEKKKSDRGVVIIPL